MTAYFFKFANLCGLLSFSITGAIQGNQRHDKAKFLRFLPCVVLTAFGGGMIFRDLFLMGIFPSALLDRKELYVSFAIAIILYLFPCVWKEKYYSIINMKRFKSLLILADGFGSGIYICSGINKAFSYGMPGHICILAGIVSTCGGGFLTSLWCGEHIYKSLVKNSTYKLIVISNSIMYYQSIKKEISQVDAQVLVTIYVTILCVLNALTKYLIVCARTNAHHTVCVSIITPLCYTTILCVIIAPNRQLLMLDIKNKTQYIIKKNGTIIVRKSTYHMLLYK